ncbi:hypothetical protein BGZ67_001779 [Mortierella alpina]|nr:hypothetical protein BGZ67_001779 [Mortierella alpina]
MLQQARLQIYMTTLHAYTQHSDIFESTLLHDYETISTLDLASFPETSEDVDFKSSLRQRSYDRAQKKQARDSRFIHVRREEQRNRQKAEQRRQQLLQHQKQQQNPHDKDSKDSKDSKNSSNDHHKKKNDSHADRSKKRVDRHRRAEDTVLALEHFSDSSSEAEAEHDVHGLNVGDHSDDGYSSSSRRHGRSGHSSSSSSWSSTDNDDSEEGECDLVNERIRFKRNLTFKTDDDGIMASTRVDSGLWKQVFVQKLDEKDQARERKKDSRSRSHKKQGGKHQGSLV